MTGKQVEKYIMRDLGMIPRHDCYALAEAVSDVAYELEHDECELLYLLLENRPITMLYTHSYGFHTATGREIINQLQNKYYEYESAS